MTHFNKDFRNNSRVHSKTGIIRNTQNTPSMRQKEGLKWQM